VFENCNCRCEEGKVWAYAAKDLSGNFASLIFDLGMWAPHSDRVNVG